MLSDEALRERLLRGDLTAFDALYDRHARPLHGFIVRYLGDAHEAEDVLHETFMALLRAPPQGAVASLRAWMFEVARNACLHRLRTRRRGVRALDAVAVEPVHRALPDEELSAHQSAERLKAAVARLPEGLAELYALRTRGLSYEELATVLAVPVGTVKSRLHDMVARLRQEMDR